MANIKVVLIAGKTNKERLNPVKIQINHRYKTLRVSLFWIEKKYFKNGKISRSHKESVKLNNIINRELAKYQARADELDRSGEPFTAFDIRDRETNDTQLLVDVVSAYKKRLEELNKANRLYRNIVTRIKEFDPNIHVHQVDKNWMDRYVNFLRDQDSISSENTVANYVKKLKTALRSDITNYFDKAVLNYKNPSSEPEVEFLTFEEMKIWKNSEVPSHLELYRDFFTFMVYCMGERVSDVLMLEPKNIKNGFIHFREGKTGERKGTGKIKKVALNKTLNDIIEKYQGMSRYYVFPLLKQIPSDPRINKRYRKHLDNYITTLNNNLKLIAAHLKIGKKITNHVARHTFASMADNENIDIRDIQLMLNHSNLKQTLSYIHRLRKANQINEEAEKVFRRLE